MKLIRLYAKLAGDLAHAPLAAILKMPNRLALELRRILLSRCHVDLSGDRSPLGFCPQKRGSSRQYPVRLAEETGRCIESARVAFAVAAENEAAHVQRVLSEKVAETSVEIARKLAERPMGLHRVTMVLAAVVAFGALCVSAGYSLMATLAVLACCARQETAAETPRRSPGSGQEALTPRRGAFHARASSASASNPESR
jgi:hypothetical protein